MGLSVYKLESLSVVTLSPPVISADRSRSTSNEHDTGRVWVKTHIVEVK